MVQIQAEITKKVKLCVIWNQVIAVIYHAKWINTPHLILPSSGLWKTVLRASSLLRAIRQRWYIFISFVWVIFMYSIYKYQSCFLHIRSQGPALEKKKKKKTRRLPGCHCSEYYMALLSWQRHILLTVCKVSWRGLWSVTAVRQNKLHYSQEEWKHLDRLMDNNSLKCEKWIRLLKDDMYLLAFFVWLQSNVMFCRWWRTHWYYMHTLKNHK